MTNQSEKNEILVKVIGLQNKIGLVATYIAGKKYVHKKLEKQNELLEKARKHQTNINETLCHENSKLLRVNKDLWKGL